MKSFFAALCGIFLLLIFSDPAHGFPFKKSGERRSKAFIAETPESRIVFSYVRRPARKDSENPKIRWVELSYKYADLEEPPGRRFAGVGGGKVRFLDQDGFVLAADVFSIQDLEFGDIYGFLWMEENRARQIVNADAVPLRSDEVSHSNRTDADAEPTPRAEKKERKEEPSEEKTKIPETPETPETSEASEPSEPSHAAEGTPARESMPLFPSPPPSGFPAPERLERGGVSNEDVEKVLETQRENPETEIPPSASTIDMPMDEETQPQEENKSGVILKQTFL